MQYLLSVIDDGTGLATTTEAAAIDVFNDRLRAGGHWVFAAGLGGPDTATVIDNRRGEALIIDGPFVESKEYLAGFWIVEAPDLDVALNRAIAVAELQGPEVALSAIDRLEDTLAAYHAYHAARADLLHRLGLSHESRLAYDRAIDLAGNVAEAAYLTRRRDDL